MDKKSFLGFLLIAIIIIFLPKYYEWVNPEYAKNKAARQVARQDTLSTQVVTESELTMPETPAPIIQLKNVFQEEEYKVETDMFYITLSNKGGGTLKSLKLKEHFLIQDKDTLLVDLINQDQEYGPYLSIINAEKGEMESLLLNFQLQNQNANQYQVTGNDSITLTFFLDFTDSEQISRSLTFYGNRYFINYVNDLSKIAKTIATENYRINWTTGISYTEKDLAEENRYSGAYARTQADDIEKFTIKKNTKSGTDFSGNTDWVAIRSKYFAIAMVPAKAASGYELKGAGTNQILTDEKKPRLIVKYGMSLDIPKHSPLKTTLYLGPLDQSELKNLDKNLDNIMSFGSAIIRPISKGVLWLFTSLYKIIPNYGFVLIVFSILIKILLHPLTLKSTQSMKEMHKLQPLIDELKEKHKENPQKLNQETMKLYSEHGVNPMGGCLPLLLQMPILFALFTVFRTTIQLRHAPFIFWITDLSAPDALFVLPFSIPFYGQNVNILPMVMVASQIFMQKMSGQSQNPQQKQMALIMPIMFFFIFNNFPSGLNLYYTLFNILTIIQQQYFTPDPKPKAKKSNQRKSRLDRMRELQLRRKQFK
ncbi:MAG: membrane protein insertase YidC [Candidatus Marinimicrobia bacterium]|nr:membrane protein insertase YidC [Candidatus Neomarinimicrobiota bacterium]